MSLIRNEPHRPGRLEQPLPVLPRAVHPVCLAAILDGLVYPAERWQVITQAGLYGCDAVTLTMLARLPQRRYASLTALVDTLAEVARDDDAPPERPVPVRALSIGHRNSAPRRQP